MKRYRKSLFFVVIMLAAVFGGCALKEYQKPVSETRLLLNTVCTITLYGAQDKLLLTEALDLCEEYEAMFSMTSEGSDIWRVNHAEGNPVAVSPQTAEVIAAGLRFGNLSDGMFDITVGRLSALWDFSGNPSVPSALALAAALETVDYRNVTLDGNTVRLAYPGAWVDLGGIAKGYIADRLAAFLKIRGAEGAVIDLGGNVYVVGEKPNGKPWRVGVRKPSGGSSGFVGTIETGEASVVTSGIYERQFESDGVMYHHILDPTDGMPVKSDVVSATVVTESSMLGDVLSTLIVLLGSESVPALLDSFPELHGAALVLDDGDLLQFGDIVME
ncbi:MAG: FAD:protein FMN transferase [Oscillospiraceae bacterium]|nr:FAD:protein FMN transferase [Oscillospiraceae bacterium]